MGDRDWLTELTTALGDQPVATAEPGDPLPPAPDIEVLPEPVVAPVEVPAPPPIDPDLDLMGPGRSLEGWAEELASAFDDDDELGHDHDDDGNHGGGGEVGLDADGDPDGVLRFDALVAEPPTPVAPVLDEAALAAAVEVAVAAAVADVAAGVAAGSTATDERMGAAEARLGRVESLLTADLSQLGPAVLADSVGELEERLAELRAGVVAATEKVEALPVPDPEALAAQPGVAGDELAESMGELRAMVDRLSDRVAAQARFLAAHADTMAADAHRRDDLLKAILARLDAWG